MSFGKNLFPLLGVNTETNRHLQPTNGTDHWPLRVAEFGEDGGQHQGTGLGQSVFLFWIWITKFSPVIKGGEGELQLITNLWTFIIIVGVLEGGGNRILRQTPLILSRQKLLAPPPPIISLSSLNLAFLVFLFR